MVCCVVLQENDLEQADKYAELAMSADRYNPAGNQNLTRTKTTLSHSHALSAHPLLVCLHLCLPVCLSLFPSHWSYYKNGSLICFLILIISALVNKGNVLYARGDYEKAREFFKEALQNDSSCVEGLYNLGTVNQIGFYRPCWVFLYNGLFYRKFVNWW